jgi:ribonuclease HI
MITNAAPEMRVKLMFLFWRVWHHRNNIVHGDGKASVSVSIPFLQNYLSSFKDANVTLGSTKGKGLLYPSQSLVSSHVDVSKWLPPPAGAVSVCVDAGWDAVSKRAGSGAVIRDDQGSIIRSSWKFHPYCESAEEAEAKACLEGLHQLLHTNRIPGILETDCQRVVQLVTSESFDRSPSWSIYLEIKDLLRTNPMLEIRKISRSSNHVAHGLAKLGKSGDVGILCGAIPICVSAAIAQNCIL